MGQSVSKIIIILSLRVSTSKNENIDHRGEETCDYESDLISLLCDSSISNVLIFGFYLLCCNPKERYHIRVKIHFKRKMFIREISVIIILICVKL